jgi:hypothetical protein
MQPRSMAQVWLSAPARVLGEACLLGEIGEFALDGGAVNVQQEGTSAHGDAGAEHATKRVRPWRRKLWSERAGTWMGDTRES